MKKPKNGTKIWAVVCIAAFCVPLCITSNVNALVQGSGVELAQCVIEDEQGVIIVPSGQDEQFPPVFPRCSFIWATGLYLPYNGEYKLVGLSFGILENCRGGFYVHHVAAWTGVLTITLEGDHAGTYVDPDFSFVRPFWGSVTGWTVGLGEVYVWNPVYDRITYIHIAADYTEDGQHIRYIDRTWTETWASSSWSIGIDSSQMSGILATVNSPSGSTSGTIITSGITITN